jgi:hypothetical protein
MVVVVIVIHILIMVTLDILIQGMDIKTIKKIVVVDVVVIVIAVNTESVLIELLLNIQENWDVLS